MARLVMTPAGSMSAARAARQRTHLLKDARLSAAAGDVAGATRALDQAAQYGDVAPRTRAAILRTATTVATGTGKTTTYRVSIYDGQGAGLWSGLVDAPSEEAAQTAGMHRFVDETGRMVPLGAGWRVGARRLPPAEAAAARGGRERDDHERGSAVEAAGSEVTAASATPARPTPADSGDRA